MLIRLFLLYITIVATTVVFGQNAYVISQGGNILSNQKYISQIIVGQTAISSSYSNNNFKGNFGFLNSTISLENQIPVANAGPDQLTIFEKNEFVLDGSASKDPEQTPITYKWRSLDGLKLSDSTVVKPKATAIDILAIKEYRFQLVVFDGQLQSSPDTVVVRISDPLWIPLVMTNSSTLYAKVTLDNKNATDGDWLAAFVGPENRGVGRIFIFNSLAYAVINIQSEKQETVSFRVYNHDIDKVCLDNSNVMSNPGNDMGSPAAPIPVNGLCGSVSLKYEFSSIAQIHIAPNPVIDRLNLEVKTSSNLKYEVEVFDALSRKRKSFKQLYSNNVNQLNFSDLAPGFYSISIKSGIYQSLYKLIKL